MPARNPDAAADAEGEAAAGEGKELVARLR